MTSAITSPIQQILALLTGATDPSELVCRVDKPERLVKLDDELNVFVLQLEHVLSLLVALNLPGQVPAIVRLGAIHDEAALLQSQPYDPDDPWLGDVVQNANQIRNAAETLQVAAKPIVAAGRFAVPGQWLESTQGDLSTHASDILGKYAEAVVTAWTTGKPALGVLADADDLMRRFPARVLDLYLQFGLQQTVTAIIGQHDALLALNHITSPSADDIVLYVDAPNRGWPPATDLANEASNVTHMFPGTTDDEARAAQAALTALLRKFQAFQVTMTALQVDQQLTQLIDASAFTTDAVTRVTGYRDALATALGQVHAGFTHVNDASDAQFATGASGVAAVIGNPQLKTDLDAAIAEVGYTTMAKSFALSLLILGAAAFSGGLAAGVAETAIDALAGDALIGGVVSFGEMGGFAAEAMMFTLVDRTGKELLFGPESTADTSYLHDLFWTAVTLGTLKLVGAGYGKFFKEVGAKSFMFRLGKFAIDNISLFAIGQVQQATESNRSAGMSDDGRALLSQLAMSIIMELGGELRGKVADRLGAGAATVDQNKLAAAEQGAISLGQQIDLAKTMKRADIDTTALSSAIETQFSGVLELARSVTDGTPGKEGVVLTLEALRVDHELHFAKIGIETTMGGKDQSSTVGPAGTNVVVVSDPAAEPVINQALALSGAPPLTDSPVMEDAKVSASPDGDITVAVPPSTVAATPATPLELALSSLDLSMLGTTVDGTPITLTTLEPIAVEGLKNLKAPRTTARGVPWSNYRIQELIGKIDKPLRMKFLMFMSDPEFAAHPDSYKSDHLIAFGSSEAAMDFASVYGVDLANTIRNVMNPDINGTGGYVLSAYAQAATELDAASTAGTTDQVFADLMTRTSAEWFGIVKPEPPVIPMVAPTPANFGIDQDSMQWKGFKARERKLYPNDSAKWDRWADIEQILQRGRNGDYATLSEPDRIEILKQFITKCDAVLETGETNGKFGYLAEELFIPDATKTVFLGEAEVSPRLSGTSKMDDFKPKGGPKGPNGKRRPWALEFKANQLYNMDTSDARSLARLHRIQISGGTIGNKSESGDVSNMPKGTQFVIWYVFEPQTQDQYDAMIYEFSDPSSKVERVKIGSQRGWVNIVKRAAP